MKFRTKPITLEATKFTGDVEALPDWCREMIANVGLALEVNTTEGTRECAEGDYFVMTPDGKQLVRNGTIFESVFEPAE